MFLDHLSVESELGPWPEPERNETLGVRTYVQRIPNTGHIGGELVTEKARFHHVTLPLLSIQERADG